MTEKEQREIFARNFRQYVDASGKTQREIAKALGYSYTTVNTWYRGAALPNAAKIQTIADYFKIFKSDLLDDKSIYPDTSADGVQINVQPMYYNDPEAATKAQELFTDPKYRVLFDAAPGSSAEDLQMAADLLLRLKQTRRD